MKWMKLGKTDAQVSALCLGTMYFGSTLEKAAAFQLLDQFADASGTFLDTANIYAGWIDGFMGGESETLLGQWLARRHNRSHMFIATKVGGILHHGHTPLHDDGPRLRAPQIATECEKSLRRLGVDTIDLYYAHMDDRQTSLEETLEAFDRLITAGKVRFVGASNTAAWRIAQAGCVSSMRQIATYCCVQQRYSYLRPRRGANFAPQVAANQDLLDYCATEGVTLLAYSPLLGGAYAGKPLPEEYGGTDSIARCTALRQVAAEHGATPHQIVLAWLNQNHPHAIPVLGVETSEQLQENLQSLDITLSADQLVRLNCAGG